MTAKLYHVQAMARGAMLLDVQILTRKARDLALQEALAACKREGSGHIRSQADGARTWAVYAYDGATGEALQLHRDGAAAACAGFDHWIQTGGAGVQFGGAA